MGKEEVKCECGLLIRGAPKSEAKKEAIFEIYSVIEVVRGYAEVPHYNCKQKIKAINAHFLFKLAI